MSNLRIEDFDGILATAYRYMIDYQSGDIPEHTVSQSDLERSVTACIVGAMHWKYGDFSTRLYE